MTRVLFYRARLEGPVAALDVSLSPVRPVPGGWPSGCMPPGRAVPGGRVRVVLRYAAPDGLVRTHRGWLHTALVPGRRLQVLGCQVDGGEVLVSLGAEPARTGRPERLRDRFDLPFRLESWGVEAVAGLEVRLSCWPAVAPGGLLLRGRAVLRIQTPAARFVRTIPFCRWVAVAMDPHPRWRGYGAVEGAECRVLPGGVVEGRLRVSVTVGGEDGAAESAHPPAAGVAAVRHLGAEVRRLAACFVTDGQALVSGRVALDVAWADRSGKGRWSCRELPFSALLPIGGLCEGDRLEPVAQVERLVRVGKGADEQVALLLGIGLTALRPAHLELSGAWYRVEQVVGQAVTGVQLAEPLFPRDERAPGPAAAAPSHTLGCETGLNGPWTRLRAHIRHIRGRPPVLAVSGTKYETREEPGSSPGGAQRGPGGARQGPAVERARVELTGGSSTPGSVLHVESVGPRWARVRQRPVPPGEDALEVGLMRGGEATAEWLALTEPARAVLGVEPDPQGRGWGVRCLVRCRSGLRLVRHPLVPPSGGGRDGPLAITASGTAIPGSGLQRLWLEARWA